MDMQNAINDTQVINQKSGKNWTMYLGDSCQVIKGIPNNSIGYSISSPPFKSLYVYSPSEADMGNSDSDDMFFEHYKFLIKEMYRVMIPGRLCSVHCKDLPKYINRDDAAGLVDFPGQIIRAFEEAVNPRPQLDNATLANATSIKQVREMIEDYELALKNWDTKPNWQFHSRVTIWKDPVIEMQRTKNHGLLHKNFASMSEACRQGMADYLITFRKWPIDEGVNIQQLRKPGDYVGTNPPQVESYGYKANRSVPEWYTGTAEEYAYSIELWQRYASPVWYDIDQTNVLNNYKDARESDLEKHICPLQLDVIARGVDLWSNEGDVVFSPFGGVGSEGWESIKRNRKFIGIELKESYWETACDNLSTIEELANRPTLPGFEDLQDETVQAKRVRK